MREFCMKLRQLVEKGTTESDLETEIENMMEQVWKRDNHDTEVLYIQSELW